MELIQTVDPWVMLRDYVSQEFSTQRKAAEAFGVSENYMCVVLSGRKPLTASMLERLGLERLVVYRVKP